MSLEPDLDGKWLARIRLGLREWYDQGHRELPWRHDRDPFRILVSEMMLVQTTATAVVPYYERFLQQFPTAEALAFAFDDDVLKAWEGLGYYRRARQLQEAARSIVRDHEGRVPDDLESLQALPGVGRYIAGAVRSFAFDLPAPIVEANTQRVLARLLAWEDEVSKPQSQKRLWQAAERLVPDHEPGLFNQAFMELGATLCTPREPMCLICPVAGDCLARAKGIQSRVPVKLAKLPPLEVSEACAVVVREGKLLMMRRDSGRLWGGFWEFPTIHLSGADPAGRSLGEPVDLAEGVRRMTGIEVRIEGDTHTVKFGVTKHRVTLVGFQATELGGNPVPSPGFSDVKFAKLREVESCVLGSAMRKIAKWAEGGIAKE